MFIHVQNIQTTIPWGSLRIPYSRIPPGHQQVMQIQVAVNQDTSSANLSNCPRTFRQILRCWTNPNLPLLFCCHRVSRVSMSFSGSVFTCQSDPILQAVDMSHALPHPAKCSKQHQAIQKGGSHLRHIPTPEWMRKQMHQDKQQRHVITILYTHTVQNIYILYIYRYSGFKSLICLIRLPFLKNFATNWGQQSALLGLPPGPSGHLCKIDPSSLHGLIAGHLDQQTWQWTVPSGSDLAANIPHKSSWYTSYYVIQLWRSGCCFRMALTCCDKWMQMAGLPSLLWVWILRKKQGTLQAWTPPLITLMLYLKTSENTWKHIP